MSRRRGALACPPSGTLDLDLPCAASPAEGASEQAHGQKRHRPQCECNQAQHCGRFAAARASEQKDQRCGSKAAEDQEPGEKPAQTIAAVSVEMVEQLHGRKRQECQTDREHGIDWACLHRRDLYPGTDLTASTSSLRLASGKYSCLRRRPGKDNGVGIRVRSSIVADRAVTSRR